MIIPLLLLLVIRIVNNTNTSYILINNDNDTGVYVLSMFKEIYDLVTNN